jgi:predicted RND superfamily exporter protein
MNDKIIVNFNDTQYYESLKTLQLNLRKLEQCLISIEEITGNKELKTLEEIEKVICNKSGFENVLASAELLNLMQPYIYLQNHLNTIDYNILENDNGTYKIKDSLLNELKEANTTYLSNEYVADFNLLSKAIVHLNKLSSPALVNCLSRNYVGEYSVNRIALQNSKF